MIIIQTVISQGHQDHLVPQELLGQEESLGLEEDQDSQDLLGSKDHLVKEECLERKVKEGLDLKDHEVCQDHLVHKENLELVHQAPQDHEDHQGLQVVLEMRVFEVLQGHLDTVIHPSVLASLTMAKDSQNHMCLKVDPINLKVNPS